MRLVTKQAIATALVDIIVFTYVCYLALGRLPIIESIRGVAAVSLVLGVASRRIGGHTWYRHQRVATFAGLVSITLGLVTLAAAAPVSPGLVRRFDHRPVGCRPSGVDTAVSDLERADNASGRRRREIP